MWGIAPSITIRSFNNVGIFRSGMSKTRQSFFGRIAQLIGGNAIDDETWDDLESLLIQADVGVKTTADVLEDTRERVRKAGVKRPEDIPPTPESRA